MYKVAAVFPMECRQEAAKRPYDRGERIAQRTYFKDDEDYCVVGRLLRCAAERRGVHEFFWPSPQPCAGDAASAMCNLALIGSEDVDRVEVLVKELMDANDEGKLASVEAVKEALGVA